MSVDNRIGSQIILDGLTQAVLIFDSSNRLVQENAAARAMLGSDLKLIRAEGWSAAAVLFNARLTDPARMVEAMRTLAIDSGQAVRFHLYRFGERIPCWMSALTTPDDLYTMVTIETPDWSTITDVVEKYLEEVREVTNSTRGHAELIAQTISRAKATDTPEALGKRIGGFTRVIDIHMFRLALLTEMIERLERVRTGKLRTAIKRSTRRVILSDFMEDFLETLDERGFVDPETDSGDARRRIRAAIPQRLAVMGAADALAQVLRDVLRNAIMYSMRGSQVQVAAYLTRDSAVQIDIIDEGYGIRANESDRVFVPFMRSRQPQIMGEFGYGLSLYLCKQEVEAMNGRIWFESEEGVGTTFSLKLPAWRDTALLPSSEG